MNKIELLPCPFCGSEPDAYYRGTRYGRIVYIKCSLCGATSKAVRYYSDKEEFDEEDIGYIKAAKLWNMRVKQKGENE